MHSQWICFGSVTHNESDYDVKEARARMRRVADPLAFIRSLRSARMRHVASETQRCGSPIKIASRLQAISRALALMQASASSMIDTTRYPNDTCLAVLFLFFLLLNFSLPIQRYETRFYQSLRSREPRASESESSRCMFALLIPPCTCYELAPSPPRLE